MSDCWIFSTRNSYCICRISLISPLSGRDYESLRAHRQVRCKTVGNQTTGFSCVMPPCPSGYSCCSSQDLTQGNDTLFWAERDVDPHCYVLSLSLSTFFILAFAVFFVSSHLRSRSGRIVHIPIRTRNTTESCSSMHAGSHVPVHGHQHHRPGPHALLLERYVPHYVRLVPVAFISRRLLLSQRDSQLLPLLHF